MTTSVVAKLRHPQWGPCELVRVEATDWIVRIESTGIQYRISSERRGQFELVHEGPEPPPEEPKPHPPRRIVVRDNAAARNARRVIESLRIGLPSLDGSTRRLAVGFSEMQRLIDSFLRDIESNGGGAMIMKGAYGQGKTFALTMLEEIAHESGFVTVRTEIDAAENQLSKPHHIYRNLMRTFRLPDEEGDAGAIGLVERVCEVLSRQGKKTARDRMQWLEEQIGCFPISWLLSDPAILSKPSLLGVFAGDPNYPVRHARMQHAIPPPQKGRQWAVFRYGTQGDFGSFVLSGLGRLVRLIGYRGMLLVLDEMEKWFALDWREQSRAGNLVGGLIWAATADEGVRTCRGVRGNASTFLSFCNCDHCDDLNHSSWCGGYPFTTNSRNHVGIAIAMTPRNHHDPEHLWSQYGPILVGEVPILTERRLIQYCQLVVPVVAEAYGLSPPTEDELEEIASEATQTWRMQGDMTTRTGVQSTIAAFDNWRDWA